MPWSAFRLLRILRGGELPATGWKGWTVRDGGRLITPAGVEFKAGEFEWWSLTCLQARSWQRSYDRAIRMPLSAADKLQAAIPVVDAGALDLVPVPECGGDADAPGTGIATLPASTEAVFYPGARRQHASGSEQPAGVRVDESASAEPASSHDPIRSIATPDTPGPLVPSSNRGLKYLKRCQSDAIMASSGLSSPEPRCG